MSPLLFILGDFWHFMGAAILLVILLDGLTNVVRAIRQSDPWHD